MRGNKALTIDDRGLGGFTEAVMALMVVTLAVILLSLSLSFTGVQVMKESEGDRTSAIASELIRTAENDVMIWDGEFLVLSSFEARCGDPYPLPEGASGFRLELSLNFSTLSVNAIMSGGVEVEGVDIHHEKLPVAVKLPTGEIVPGILDLVVW